MADMHVLHIPVDGPMEMHHVADAEFLDYLHERCGEPVDVVRLRGAQFGEMSAWVNDVGLLTGLPPNERLMALAAQHGRLGQMLVGNCVITGGVTPEGEDESLTPEQMADLLAFFSERGA